MGELFSKVLKNIVLRDRVSSTGGNAQMEPVSTTLCLKKGPNFETV